MTMPDPLARREADAIYVLREVFAECARAALLFSGGKDSAVLLHLARKASYPARPPLTLLHVASGFDFRELLVYRDETASEAGLPLVVHTNEAGIRGRVAPWTHGAAYADVMLTEALRQALEAGGYDAAIGGGRRDEERSRAKERVFSFRTAGQRWDPRRQRPELWHLYNLRHGPGESLRAFPLSDWTERDVWRYIEREGLRVAPLYFTAPRPVVERDGRWIVVDDERLPLAPGERPTMRRVRFRTLGCYPLTAAVESEAGSVADILRELASVRMSERSGRAVDRDAPSALERRKREGYF
jgi:sulfate adenylyltransferase subunit 2